ncbi:hypothetical protein AB0J83_19720 [Actinoplanes sp. NPDC049596]|uniref:hypothetical protein n=1 Tax=unclassified Actinoplanes TaxID=2626549 RepID=UPI003413ECCC
MSDHHDFGDHEDFPIFDDHPLPEHEQPVFEPYEPYEHYDTFDVDHHVIEEPAYDAPEHVDHGEPEPQPEIPAEDPLDVFPPQVDVGELPEPVDGFPWIDTGSLGVVPAEALAEHTEPVRPEELAEYAGEQLPPGADPWAALAESEDPATSALARWWQQN